MNEDDTKMDIFSYEDELYEMKKIQVGKAIQVIVLKFILDRLFPKPKLKTLKSHGKQSVH